MVHNHRQWDYDVVADIFNNKDRELILQIPLGTRLQNDTWYWLPNPKVLYTFRSYYRMLDNLSNPPNSGIW